ncbi:hypothetical protein [Wukongibacter sp. M2B1]
MTWIREQLEKNGYKILDLKALEIAKGVEEISLNSDKTAKELIEQGKELL